MNKIWNVLITAAIVGPLVLSSCGGRSAEEKAAAEQAKVDSVAAAEAIAVKPVETADVELAEIAVIDKVTEFPISWDKRSKDGYFHICVRTETDKGKTFLKLLNSKGTTASECEVGTAGIGLSCYVRPNKDTVLVVDPSCTGCRTTTRSSFAVKVSDIGGIGAHNFEIAPYYRFNGASVSTNLCIIGMDDARDGNFTGSAPSNGFCADFRDITLPGLTIIKLSYDPKDPQGTKGSIFLTAQYIRGTQYNDKDNPAGTPARSKPVIDWTCN